MSTSADTALETLGHPPMLQQELVREESAATAEANHLAVRESMQIALHASFVRCGRCWLLLIMSLVLGAGCVTAWSETIYEKHAQDKCDQPLAPMLRILYIIGLVNIFQRDIVRCILCHDPRDSPVEPLRVTLFRRAAFLATALWPIAGGWMSSMSSDCSIELKTAVKTVLIYYVVTIAVVFVLPALFISAMLCLVRRGLVTAPLSEDAAPEGFIDDLPVLEYDPALFDEEETGGYSSTCSICLDNFDAEQKISETPCGQGPGHAGHAFHTECLRGWLRCSRTCPLCRVDLTEALVGGASGLVDAASAHV